MKSTAISAALAVALASAQACAAAKTASAAPARSSRTARRTAAAKPAAKPAAQAKSSAQGESRPPQTQFRRSPYVGAIAVDASTGKVLFSRNTNAPAYPASITKLMTAFLVLDDVKAGRISLSDKVVASPTRTKLDVHLRQASHIGLKPGDSMSVDKLLELMLVHSANDAAVFLAEKCSGSMEAFVARMNAKARTLGMVSTCFYNPNGLPPMASDKERKFNVSTCSDLVLLARALLSEHPDILKYTSIKVASAEYPAGKQLRFVNHNNVMVKDKLKVINPDGSEAVDGLKTGFIEAGGSSVLLTGRRGGRRAIVVVLGSYSKYERDDAAAELLEDALDAISL